MDRCNCRGKVRGIASVAPNGQLAHMLSHGASVVVGMTPLTPVVDLAQLTCVQDFLGAWYSAVCNLLALGVFSFYTHTLFCRAQHYEARQSSKMRVWLTNCTAVTDNARSGEQALLL